jgi:ribosome maturation factor RimP
LLVRRSFPGTFRLSCSALAGERSGKTPVMVLQLNPTAKKVVELIEPHVERQGFELVGIDFRKGTRTSLLRLLVDRPGGGIAMSDLEVLSPIIGDLLDVYDPVEGRYLLEVASPGVNRPLTKLAHFEAFVGQRVKVRTHRPHNGRKNFEGVLAAVSTNGLELDDEISHGRESFGFDEIKGANYEHKFD